MNSSWPPNPRDAKRRQVIKTWHGVPVTMVLIAVCLLTALRTQMGKQPEAADWMFFRSQTEQLESKIAYNSLVSQWRSLESEGRAEDDPEFKKLEVQIVALSESLKDLNTSNDGLADIKSGEIWRLFTPMFLHFGMIHIIFNLYWLWIFGSLLEIRYRPLKYLWLILGVALVSNLAEGLIKGPNFGGMSGVNYGLFGFLFMHGKYHPSPFFRLDRQTVFMMLAWLVFCFSGALGPVANWAHLFGFLTGAAAGFSNAMIVGGAKIIKRRGEFKSAISSAQFSALHECKVCGITEQMNPDAEFRVCADGNEYCVTHLPAGESL